MDQLIVAAPAAASVLIVVGMFLTYLVRRDRSIQDTIERSTNAMIDNTKVLTELAVRLEVNHHNHGS